MSSTSCIEDCPESTPVKPLPYGGLRFALRPSVIEDVWVFLAVLFAREYDSLNLLPSDNVLDVGANIGVFSVLTSLRCKSIFSVEANPSNFQLLQTNLSLNAVRNCLSQQVAASDRRGVLHMEGQGGLSRIARDGVPVKSDTLDSILQNLGSPRIDVLKMDIEGHEVEALRGFSGLRDVREAIIEVHSPALLRKTREILESLGFHLRDVSRIKGTRVLRELLLHPISFALADSLTSFHTTRSTLSYFLGLGPSPVAASNEGADQCVILATK